MDEQIKQITELFAAPRGNVKLVANFGGVNIYTSTTLKLNFHKAMLKTSRVAPIAKTIHKLMDKGEFFVCYLTDKILKTLLKRQPPEFKGYAGMTLGKYIMVFVDNDTNIFGFASNNDLSVTALHELIHKASNKFPKQFFQTFKSELTDYYTDYWSKLFNLERDSLDAKTVQNIVYHLYTTSEVGKRDTATLKKYHRMLLEATTDITTLSRENLEKIITQYMVVINVIWKAMSAQTPKLIEQTVFANRFLIVPLYDAYRTAFGISVRHIKELCYQELYAPSEVISLPALIKRPDQKVYKMINKL